MITILLILLLLSTYLPPMQGLTDDVLMPKWYGVVMMVIGYRLLRLISQGQCKNYKMQK